ncbi:MAG: cytochrome c [Rhodocyclaceae bacterium]|nr:cytochrome c [Rhodocyclaceae bacterium]MDZ4214312.1 cytochrome c [Rhodocyclaceae bacterium]
MNAISLLRPLLAVAALTLATTGTAADVARGKALHDKQCVSCHIKRFGGDGSEMYLRADRLIRDRKALGQRVATCNAMVNAGLFPEDEADIAAYLAQRYYKFAK